MMPGQEHLNGQSFRAVLTGRIAGDINARNSLPDNASIRPLPRQMPTVSANGTSAIQEIRFESGMETAVHWRVCVLSR
jgi:hypothetical protein